ncbi:MAG: SPOR domain-containing protein [Pseudomonadota bacterium]
MDQGYQQNPHPSAGTAERMRTVGHTISTWVGAVIAMVLLLGLGTWFYHLGVRDAQQVPIIRASSEPVKVRPTDKGGEVTPHQDISSYDAGTVEDPGQETTTLAPAPAEPTEEDVAMADLRPLPKPGADVEQAAEPSPQPEPEQEAEPEAGQEAEQEVLAVTREPEPDPVVEDLPEAEPAPLPTPQELNAALEALRIADQEAAAAAPKPVSSGNEFAPDYSPLSVKRPADLKERMEAAAKNAEGAEERLAAVAEKSRIKVQLRASPDREEIIASWNRIRRVHSDVVGEKSLVLQLTKSGGQTFYRLRLGPFENRAEANAVCQALKARSQDCIVTSDG